MIWSLRTPKVPRTLPRPLSIKEARQVIEEAGVIGGDPWLTTRDAALYTMLWACGLRIGEALGLNRKQAPEGESMVITGKGNRQRMVPVLSIVPQRIDAYLAACPYKLKPDDPLFVGKINKAKISFLTDEETAVMLKASERIRSDLLRILIVLGVTSGMRRGEMLALSWSNVDLDGHTVTVEQALEEAAGVLQFKQPKSESSLRTIEIPKMTVEALRQHRVRQAEYRLKLGCRDNDWLVFETPRVQTDGTVEFHPWHPIRATKAFTHFIRRTPVRRISLHGLRHTWITSALMAGKNIKVISELAGHSSIQITLDVYGHVLPGRGRDIAESHEQRLRAYWGPQG